MKPFNLEEAKAGEPVCTRDGRPVRIVCFDVSSNDYPLLALVQDSGDGLEYIISYTLSGQQYVGEESSCDLVMISEIKEGWINLCKDKDDLGGTGIYLTGSRVYASKEEAERACIRPLFTTIKITWEE